MNSKLGRVVWVIATTVLIGAAGAAQAEGSHGGRFGGGGRYEGGHSGGGAHFAAPARAQVAMPRFEGGGRFAGRAPAPAPGYEGQRFAAAPAYSAGARYTGGARYAPAQRYARAGHGNWNRTGDAGHWDGDRRWVGARDGDDDWHRDHYWVGTYWGGGYWGGGYWPGVYYGVDFAWFLPVLPGVYATYWYGGVPYYYANDVYYTWDPAYDGYVATDPPPVAGSSAAAPGGDEQIFMYPNRGQSDEQQAEDRRACERWASDQVGGSADAGDYRRAMTACAEGRGYTVR